MLYFREVKHEVYQQMQRTCRNTSESSPILDYSSKESGAKYRE